MSLFNTLAKLHSKVTNGYMYFLDLAGLTVLAMGAILVGLIVPIIWIVPVEPQVAFTLDTIPAYYTHPTNHREVFTVRFLRSGGCFLVSSLLLHPNAFGPVITLWQRLTPDGKRYTGSYTEFLLLQMVRPLFGIVALSYGLFFLINIPRVL